MKKALIVYGGWDGHEPKACSEIVAGLLRGEGLAVEMADSLAAFDDAGALQACDVIIPAWTMGEISGAQCANLMAAVQAGSGLAGWHGGMCDAFRSNTEYQWMTGGQFVAHPGNHKDYTVDIVRPGDPVVAGIAAFPVHSEQYYMHVDPRVEVLATTTFHPADHPWLEGVVMPVLWKTCWGAGRVFYSALGHCAEEFQDGPVRETLRRGILWACR